MHNDHADRLASAADVIAQLRRPDLVEALQRASMAVCECLQSGGTILIAGNGGSAADASHLAAEFVGRCTTERHGLPAISLADASATITALGNDYGFERVFARQVEAFAQPGDVLIVLSTSGTSPNIVAALDAARARGITTIAFGGRDGGQMLTRSDVALIAPSDVTARIQECHQVWAHVLAEDVDRLWAEE